MASHQAQPIQSSDAAHLPWDMPPQLKLASYRFDSETGITTIMYDKLVQPNEITISPDDEHMYI